MKKKYFEPEFMLFFPLLNDVIVMSVGDVDKDSRFDWEYDGTGWN